MAKKFLLIFIILAAAILAGLWLTNRPQVETEINLAAIEPTNFSRIGVMVINNPGFKPGVPYLIYEEPGKPALNVELRFDDLSLFVSGSVSFMVNTQDTSWHGQGVVLEGIEKQGVVLARKIKLLASGETATAISPGSLFISWQEAQELMGQCRVERIMQTHALDVYFTLKTGERVRAVEPAIDVVITAYGNVEEKCGKILLGTE